MWLYGNNFSERMNSGWAQGQIYRVLPDFQNESYYIFNLYLGEDAVWNSVQIAAGDDIAAKFGPTNVIFFYPMIGNGPGLSNTIAGSLWMHTNNAPTNAVTPKRWIDFTNKDDGQVYKIPLYQ